MAQAFTSFNSFKEDLGLKIHDFRTAGDLLKVVLTNTLPVVANSVLADITQIAAGNGYVTDGEDIDNDQSLAGGVNTISGNDVIWTASGGIIGPFTHVVLYNDTPASPLNPLIGFWATVSTVTLNDGDMFTLDVLTSLFTLSG